MFIPDQCEWTLKQHFFFSPVLRVMRQSLQMGLNIPNLIFCPQSPLLLLFQHCFALPVILQRVCSCLSIPNDMLSRAKKSRQVSAAWGSIFPGKTSLVLSIYPETLQGRWASQITMTSINCHYSEIHVRSLPCFSVWASISSKHHLLLILKVCLYNNQMC